MLLGPGHNCFSFVCVEAERPKLSDGGRAACNRDAQPPFAAAQFYCDLNISIFLSQMENSR